MTEIEVFIKLDNLELSALEAVETKNAIADTIEEKGVGQVTGSGFGFGMIDLDVDLAQDENAVERLKTILDDFNVLERSSFHLLSEDKEAE